MPLSHGVCTFGQLTDSVLSPSGVPEGDQVPPVGLLQRRQLALYTITTYKLEKGLQAQVKINSSNAVQISKFYNIN